MFDFCSIAQKRCPFCASFSEDKRNMGRCGMKSGENRIAFMKDCPLPAVKKRSKIKAKKEGL
jgi:hypothetical protein|tara:strand:+ start:467 stop:652 length:186 start_codon:yes stop_codon:yes gene_type:complete